MSKKRKIQTLLGLTANLAIAVMEIIGMVLMTQMYINLGLNPLGYLQYYTQLSNLFSFFTSTATAVFLLKSLIKNKYSMPDAVRVLKLSSTSCLTETILVVIFVLSPMKMMGGFIPLMFYGGNLYHHFLCPVLAIISFILLDGGCKITFRHSFLAFIPTILYGIVSVTLNILKVWHGPYPFLYVYEQPLYMSLIWAVVILGGAYAITLGVRLLANIHRSKSEKV